VLIDLASLLHLSFFHKDRWFYQKAFFVIRIAKAN
jgi:hypothetical protein